MVVLCQLSALVLYIYYSVDSSDGGIFIPWPVFCEEWKRDIASSLVLYLSSHNISFDYLRILIRIDLEQVILQRYLRLSSNTLIKVFKKKETNISYLLFTSILYILSLASWWWFQNIFQIYIRGKLDKNNIFIFDDEAIIKIVTYTTALK